MSMKWFELVKSIGKTDNTVSLKSQNFQGQWLKKKNNNNWVFKYYIEHTVWIWMWIPSTVN
jgi:hypothetical protein